jgi:DNA-binding HxlR family transcriptional regulator
MLAWIGRHGIVTPAQVARRFFARSDGQVGMRAVWRRLARLQTLGLVHRDATPHWHSPHVVRLTKAGAKAGEVDIAPARLV